MKLMSIFNKLRNLGKHPTLTPKHDPLDSVAHTYATRTKILELARNPNHTRAVICKDKDELESIKHTQITESRFYVAEPPFANSSHVTSDGWLVVGEPIPNGYAACDYCDTIKQRDIPCHNCGGV